MDIYYTMGKPNDLLLNDHYKPDAASSPPIHKQHDDRIGERVTTIRVPENFNVATLRYEQDALYREVMQNLALQHHTNPHTFIHDALGKEVRVRNEAIGENTYSKPMGDTYAKEIEQETTQEDSPSQKQPNPIVRFLKGIF